MFINLSHGSMHAECAQGFAFDARTLMASRYALSALTDPDYAHYTFRRNASYQDVSILPKHFALWETYHLP